MTENVHFMSKNWQLWLRELYPFWDKTSFDLNVFGPNIFWGQQFFWPIFFQHFFVAHLFVPKVTGPNILLDLNLLYLNSFDQFFSDQTFFWHDFLGRRFFEPIISLDQHFLDIFWWGFLFSLWQENIVNHRASFFSCLPVYRENVNQISCGILAMT